MKGIEGTPAIRHSQFSPKQGPKMAVLINRFYWVDRGLKEGFCLPDPPLLAPKEQRHLIPNQLNIQYQLKDPILLLSYKICLPFCSSLCSPPRYSLGSLIPSKPFFPPRKWKWSVRWFHGALTYSLFYQLTAL